MTASHMGFKSFLPSGTTCHPLVLFWDQAFRWPLYARRAGHIDGRELTLSHWNRDMKAVDSRSLAATLRLG